MRNITLTTVLWAFVLSGSARAQGMHDWGMWFGTLVIIGAAAVLVALLIAVMRWLRR